MRFSCSYLALLAILAGCQGPILTGGFNQSPYRAYGVDGPGPGVVPESYQPTSLPGSIGQGVSHVGIPSVGIPNVGQPEIPTAAQPQPVSYQPPPYFMVADKICVAQPQVVPHQPQPVAIPTSQINFIGLESLTLNWDAKFPGTFDSEPCVCPATHDFGQGAIYRLKLSNIPGRQGKELYPTLEIAPTMARTQAFLAHNSIPIEFTDNDFDQVFSGNFITKVVYLPNPEYQGLAMAGVGTLVNTQLEPGVDPIVEASNRGAILAVIRMGNKDLSSTVAEKQRQVLTAPAFVTGLPAQGGYPVNGSSIPQNTISGVNIPHYGTPMTKTSTGIPGPPQLPQGSHSPNRYPIVRAEPIPAAPRPVLVPQPTPVSPIGVNPIGVNPQNVLVHPHYTSQLQQLAAQQQQQQQQAQQPAVAAPVESQPQPQNPTLAP
ncbi:MAG: hypothetical protein LBF88_00360 [Planctomycetaceae bacterium]|jgi:hypothetical protein|nr:hypothetical protein [Planctomycetaceae bacterium]